ncbi:hypothetical protein I5M27_10665 [Adhaeribacter sp. BT258]|uniref:ABC transporter ATPase n=1 Tax=Adhaeribacter terrigena TaxID=2793070 RepID=A0ABS1C226_9BACT|nr:hypothetical protein [Adhaeribacter terrigena]MBK0403449.1 hypothetical protein [Adhaeribacter terrigena]
MYVPFEQLPPQARIWIYQSDREFTETEAAEIQDKIEKFVTEWSAHGQQLHASGQLLHRRFVVLGTDVNVTAPSGCSIDSSVKFLRILEMDYQTRLFDRTHLAFQKNGAINIVHLTEMPAAVASGEITAETPYFDNLVAEAGGLKANWVKPAGKTWLQKYFS